MLAYFNAFVLERVYTNSPVGPELSRIMTAANRAWESRALIKEGPYVKVSRKLVDRVLVVEVDPEGQEYMPDVQEQEDEEDSQTDSKEEAEMEVRRRRVAARERKVRRERINVAARAGKRPVKRTGISSAGRAKRGAAGQGGTVEDGDVDDRFETEPVEMRSIAAGESGIFTDDAEQEEPSLLTEPRMRVRLNLRLRGLGAELTCVHVELLRSTEDIRTNLTDVSVHATKSTL